MIDVLVLVLCAIAAFMGWRRGALLTALPVLGLVVGYGAALFLYEPIGALLNAGTGLPVLPSYVAGGALALLGVTLAVRGLSWWVRRRQKAEAAMAKFAQRLAGRRERSGRDPEGEEASPSDVAASPALPGAGLSRGSRAAGAVLGGAWAFGVAMVLVWGVESVAALTGSADLEASVTGRVGGRAAGLAGRALAEWKTGDDFVGSAAAELLEDPAGFSTMTRRLFDDDDVRRLVSDRDLAELLAAGRVAELARRPELARLAEDPTFVEAARRLGMVGEDPPSVEELAGSMTEALGPVARVTAALGEDPGVGEVIRRFDLPDRLRKEGVAGLVGDPDVRALAARVGAALKRQAGGSP